MDLVTHLPQASGRFRTDSNFSTIAGDTGEIIPLESFSAPANSIPAGTYYWRVRYKNSAGIWSGWSLEPTSFTLSAVPQTKTIFKDRFSVISNGDVNHQYNIAGRQFGNSSPLIYNCKGGASTVTVFRSECWEMPHGWNDSSGLSFTIS